MPGAILGTTFLAARRRAAAVITILGALLLAACTPDPPLHSPSIDRFADLRAAVPPPPPVLGAGDTDDEAEIQFRAAFVFYRNRRWEYAAAAFREVLEYDDDRHDARFYLAASLVLADRNEEAVPILEELLETPYEMPARPLLARVLFRQGKRAEARAVAAAAVREDFDAAGWAARYDLLAP